MQRQSSYKVHMNTISNGELSDPLCDSVNRGLTLVRLTNFLIPKHRSLIVEYTENHASFVHVPYISVAFTGNFYCILNCLYVKMNKKTTLKPI